MLQTWSSRLAGGIAASVVLAGTAHAHAGHHDGMSLASLVAHLADPFHALPLVAGAAAGIVAVLVVNRRAAARRAARSKEGRS
jgi:hypothetical protein